MNERPLSTHDRKKSLCQFPTPMWVAEALIERHFPHLDSSDCVVEPSCGPGNFLKAIPAHVRAIGVDIDPDMVATASEETGRQVLLGDFSSIHLDVVPTAIIGNPPFISKVFDRFLDRSFDLLPDGARAGFILPAYFFMSAERVRRYAERWSINVELLPRGAFHARLQVPLTFTVFSKDRARVMVGLVLHRETDSVAGMARPYRAALMAQRGSAWKAVCKLTSSPPKRLRAMDGDSRRGSAPGRFLPTES